MSAVLESWAILEYLGGREPAAPAVAELLSAQRPLISWINLGEVFYIIRRRHGDAEASTTVRDLQDVVTAELPTSRRVLAAARIKSDYAMAYADAFAAATAQGHMATLWTGGPDLLIENAPWSCRDLRPSEHDS